MIIYKVTNLVNNKIYIGLTTRTLEIRKSYHIYDALNYNSNLAFHRALRKYGENNFEWKIIDTAISIEELNEKEMHWIAYYGSFGKDGYNMTIGGGGTTGSKLSDAHKKKISESHKGKILSEETKRKLSESHKGKTLTDETKQKISEQSRIIGMSKRGSEDSLSKLKEKDVLEIKELIKEGIPYGEISTKYNVRKETVSDIKVGRTWQGVGEDISYIKVIYGKLTENDVISIKNLIKDGNMTLKEIAKTFNVKPSTISAIKCGKNQKNTGDDLSHISYSKNSRTAKAKLTEEEVRKIKLLLKEGKMTQKEIANKFNVGKSTVGSINTGESWKHVDI